MTTYRKKYDLWLDPAVVAMVKYVHETDDLSFAIERMIKDIYTDIEIDERSAWQKITDYVKETLGLGKEQ